MLSMYIKLLKKMWKDERGIEGLPLKYAILILVAALVIAIVIAMVTGLKFGILQSTSQINQTMVEQVNQSLSGI